MAESKSVTTIVSHLKEIEKEEKIKKNCENESKEWNGVLVRIRLLKALLNIINILSNVNLSEHKLGTDLNYSNESL